MPGQGEELTNITIMVVIPTEIVCILICSGFGWIIITPCAFQNLQVLIQNHPIHRLVSR